MRKPISNSNLVTLPIVKDLKYNLKQKNALIQVVVGPRQVGKTTSVDMYLKHLKKDQYLYASADVIIQRSNAWLLEQWVLAQQKNPRGTLIIDEIQQVENWSTQIKKLWDQQRRQRHSLKVILLGSSSLDIQKGLEESLTGRYQLHQMHHWNFAESYKGYGLSHEDFIVYGGYPGSYRFLNNEVEWLKYLRHSIIEPVIGKDILSLARVKSAALFKQCFDLVCSYPAQEISYTKLLGQLQDKGHIDTIKYYLELLEGAFLVKQVFKFSVKERLVRSSSPKLLPLCPALYSVYKDAELDSSERGRAFEVIVGMVLNRLPGQVFYWRERNYEVDYVYKYKKKLYAIEVKSGRANKIKGLQRFIEKFKGSIPLIVTPQNYEKLLSQL